MEFKSKIKTVADAFAYTNRDATILLNAFDALPDQDKKFMSHSYMRTVVTEALNQEANRGEKWTPNWSDGKWKYESWVSYKIDKAGVGFVVYVTLCGLTYSVSIVGSRLCFISSDVCNYFNEQFADLLQVTMAE